MCSTCTYLVPQPDREERHFQKLSHINMYSLHVRVLWRHNGCSHGWDLGAVPLLSRFPTENRWDYITNQPEPWWLGRGRTLDHGCWCVTWSGLSLRGSEVELEVTQITMLLCCWQAFTLLFSGGCLCHQILNNVLQHNGIAWC